MAWTTYWCGDLCFVKAGTPKAWLLMRWSEFDPLERVGETVYYEGGAFKFEGVEDREKEQILEFYKWHMNYLPDRPDRVFEQRRG